MLGGSPKPGDANRDPEVPPIMCSSRGLAPRSAGPASPRRREASPDPGYPAAQTGPDGGRRRIGVSPAAVRSESDWCGFTVDQIQQIDSAVGRRVVTYGGRLGGFADRGRLGSGGQVRRGWSQAVSEVVNHG